MSANSYEFHAGARTAGRFGQISSNLQTMVANWLARARQRRQLARLDSRQLTDIDLTRAEALAEASKSFWQR